MNLPADYLNWKVCAQEGGLVEGSPATVVLHLAENSCPTKIGDRLTPEPAPAPPGNKPETAAAAPPNTPTGSGTSGAGTNGGGGSDGGTSGGGSSSSGGSSSIGGDSSGGSSGGGSSPVVHPGSFCSPAGASGVTSAGTAMVCGPGSDGRNRWKKS
ncbi:hypothetical protein AB0P15_33585 [Streptomyces sp. NPDC087917]|uniref:hypothetical protein n=1 Tax=Streptomyces sp. NPDC087917 TaxID=3155060 RepID=UPI00342BEAC7